MSVLRRFYHRGASRFASLLAPISWRCLCLISILLAAGCPPPAVRPYPAPTAQALLAHLQVRARAVQSLRVRAKADYLDRGDRVKVTIAALSARPDKLRIAAENSLTGPLVTLATDGQTFQLLDVRQNRFLQGPVSPCNIALLIRADLQPHEVVEVLLGGAALLPQISSAQVAWDPSNGGREVLTLREQSGRTEVLWLSARDPQHRDWDVVQGELRDPAGQVLWRVQHQDFEGFPVTSQNLQKSSVMEATPAGGVVRLPRTTFIEDPAHHSDVRLRWRERELNPQLPGDAFHLDPPQGVPIEPAACHD